MLMLLYFSQLSGIYNHILEPVPEWMVVGDLLARLSCMCFRVSIKPVHLLFLLLCSRITRAAAQMCRPGFLEHSIRKMNQNP